MDDLRLMTCRDDWPHAAGLMLVRRDGDGRPVESAALAGVDGGMVLFAARGRRPEWRSAAGLVAEGWGVD